MNVDDRSWALRQLQLGKSLDYICNTRNLTRTDVVELGESNRLHTTPDGARMTSAPKGLDIAGNPKPAAVQDIPERFTAPTPPRDPEPRPPVAVATPPQPTAPETPAVDRYSRIVDIANEIRRLDLIQEEIRTQIDQLQKKKWDAQQQTDELGRELRKLVKGPDPTFSPSARNLLSDRAKRSSTAYYDRIAAIGASQSDIRAWAVANGIDCPYSPRIKSAVLDAYIKAHPPTGKATTP